MPFTFAHPVITMHWWRRKDLPVSALIIGCMSPDVEYFAHFRAAGQWGHDGWGILLFNLPVVALLFLLFEKVIRPVLYDYLPGWFPYRWHRQGVVPKRAAGWLLVLTMGMAGVLSHLLWDQFTHQGAWIVQHVAILQFEVSIGPYAIPVYKLLQHGSSLAGLGLTAWWIHRHLKTAPANRSVHRRYRSLFWSTAGFIAVMLLIVAGLNIVTAEGIAGLLQLIVPILSSLMLSLMIVCLLFFRTVRNESRNR